MPSLTMFENLMDDARKDGEKTGLLVAMNAVDILVAHSTSFEDFQEKWANAKALYQEHCV